MAWHYKRKLEIGENRVAVLAQMIREVEKAEGIIFPFESIRKIAKKNGFTDGEIAELEVMYF